MKPTPVPPRLVLAVLAAAAILAAAAPPAQARAPSTADQGSMDWLLLRFARDREEESKGGGAVDPVVAFKQGDGPFEGDGGWKAMLAIVFSPTEKPGRKAEATMALVDRFKLEEERRAKIPEDDRRAAEVKALQRSKFQVCLDTMSSKGMLSSNQVVLACVLRIQKALLPTEWVTWKESDSLKARRKAYDDLTKRVK